jgi:hypothetical protein
MKKQEYKQQFLTDVKVACYNEEDRTSLFYILANFGIKIYKPFAKNQYWFEIQDDTLNVLEEEEYFEQSELEEQSIIDIIKFFENV